MTTYAFNTLEQTENLQRSGFSESQAKGLVEVIALSTSNLATKQDIEHIRIATRQDIENIRLATKQDIEHIKLELRFEIQQELAEFKQETYHELSEFKHELNEFKEETRHEFKNIHLALAKLDSKILSMTVSLGTVMIAALGGYTYRLQWLN